MEEGSKAAANPEGGRSKAAAERSPAVINTVEAATRIIIVTACIIIAT